MPQHIVVHDGTSGDAVFWLRLGYLKVAAHKPLLNTAQKRKHGGDCLCCESCDRLRAQGIDSCGEWDGLRIQRTPESQLKITFKWGNNANQG